MNGLLLLLYVWIFLDFLIYLQVCIYCLYTLRIWQSSGSPPSAFSVPYDSFRKQRDLIATDNSNDMNSSPDEVGEIESKELDYDFTCFFLSSQRLHLYRSIDYRCEDMLSGKSYLQYFFMVYLSSFICFT